MTLTLMVTKWLPYFLASHLCSRQEGGRRVKGSSAFFFFFFQEKGSIYQLFPEVLLGQLCLQSQVSVMSHARPWVRRELRMKMKSSSVCSAEETGQYSSHECTGYTCVMALVVGIRRKRRHLSCSWRKIAEQVYLTWKCDRSQLVHTETKPGFLHTRLQISSQLKEQDDLMDTVHMLRTTY